MPPTVATARRRVGRRMSLTRLLWTRFTWRHWRMAPGRTILLILILALGVAVFFSIRLANRAAMAGFRIFTESVTGESDLVIVPHSGRLLISDLSKIRETLGPVPAGLYPVLEGTASLPMRTGKDDGFRARQFLVLGLDLAALPNLIYLTEQDETNVEWRVGERESFSLPLVVVPQRLAESLKLSPGDRWRLVVDDAEHVVEVGGYLPEPEMGLRQPEDLIVMDLPQWQDLTGQRSYVHRLEVRLPSGSLTESWRAEVRDRLTVLGRDRWAVETPAGQRRTGGEMTRAFRLNLTILSCLALLVGMYLILQALEAAVVRRRPEMATLRSLGVTGATIRQSWLWEAVALGFLGALLGLLLGWGMAQLTVRAVAQTVNALYYSNTTQAAAWDWNEALLAGGLGVMASLFGGWLPARDAAQTPPAQILKRGVRSDGLAMLRHPAIGLVFLVCAFGLHLAPPWRTNDGASLPLAGYVAAFLWVTGAAILVSGLFPWVAAIYRRFGSNNPLITYAGSQLKRATGRHCLAAGGLVVAVAMAGGMAILIGSFEKTVTRWLTNVMTADLFVACQGVGNASSSNRISPQVWRKLESDAAIASAEITQYYRIRIDDKPCILAGADFHDKSRWNDAIWIDEPNKSLAESAKVAVISEPFAYRFGKTVGDEVTLPTPSGTRVVPIVGVFADFGNEFGTVAVSRPLLAEWYQDQQVATLALFVKDGENVTEVRERLQAHHSGLVIRNNQELRMEALRVFHQTFAVTRVLKWIGVMVALAGLALALTSILLERRRELLTLKELGMMRRHVGRSVMWEGLGLAISGLAVGLLLSFVLGHLIIHVINRQSFGWTLFYRIPWLDMAMLTMGVLLVAGFVSYHIGHRAAALPWEIEE